jgi:hypothetical protein
VVAKKPNFKNKKEKKMDIINKIENQTKKYMELRQEIESIVKAMNYTPAWAQSIDDAKARAKELRRRFNKHYVVNIFLATKCVSPDELQELFEENEQVLRELEEIRDFLNSWLIYDDVVLK